MSNKELIFYDSGINCLHEYILRMVFARLSQNDMLNYISTSKKNYEMFRIDFIKIQIRTYFKKMARSFLFFDENKRYDQLIDDFLSQLDIKMINNFISPISETYKKLCNELFNTFISNPHHWFKGCNGDLEQAISSQLYKTKRYHAYYTSICVIEGIKPIPLNYEEPYPPSKSYPTLNRMTNTKLNKKYDFCEEMIQRFLDLGEHTKVSQSEMSDFIMGFVGLGSTNDYVDLSLIVRGVFIYIGEHRIPVYDLISHIESDYNYFFVKTSVICDI